MVHSGLWAGSALQLQTGALKKKTEKNNSPRSISLLSQYFLSLSSVAQTAALERDTEQLCGFCFFLLSVIAYYKLS